MRKKKVPVEQKEKERSVRPTKIPPDSGMVCWRFSIMDTSGPFAFSRLSPSTWGSILKKMKEWESMTWGEILGDRNHDIAVESLSAKAQERLREIQMDDIDDVCSLHLDGRTRLIGIRNAQVFKLLWWDPEHQVCPSNKKHT